MREEIAVTAQLIYDCPMDAALTEQSDMIHADLTRLLDADSTTGVACCGVTIQHIAPEAETYGTTEARQLAERQSDRIKDALQAVYDDTEDARSLLIYALCDLRHFADQNGLSFGLNDKAAHQLYRAERDSKTGEVAA